MTRGGLRDACRSRLPPFRASLVQLARPSTTCPDRGRLHVGEHASGIGPHRSRTPVGPRQTKHFRGCHRPVFRSGPQLAFLSRRKAVTVAQRIIEILSGRLITDQQFRGEFLTAPETTLAALSDRGLELSRAEMAALIDTDPTL